MNKDQMTPDERLWALLRGEPVDRVPFIPFIFGHTAWVCGQPIAKTFDDAALSFRCHMLAREMYGYDGGPLYAYALAGAWEMGGEIEFPYKKYMSAPIVTKRPVQNEDDVYKLQVPEDVSRAGAIPIYLEFARRQAEAGMPITVHVGSPSCFADAVMGTDLLMLWMIKKPHLVHMVMDKVSDFTIKVAELWVREFGPERIMAFHGCGMDSNQLVSPRQFAEYSMKYHIKINQRLIELGITMNFTHICGEENRNLPYWQQVPFGKRALLSFGHEVPLQKAMEMFPDHIIAGNVNTTVMQEGTPEEVLALSRECVEIGKQHQAGFALMSSCDVPVYTPPVNLYQMVKACREYGRY